MALILYFTLLQQLVEVGAVVTQVTLMPTGQTVDQVAVVALVIPYTHIQAD
jgi:hypothetical protein